MKAIVKKEIEIEIAAVRIQVPVRFKEEDIPDDFPLRNGDMWEAVVEMDTGRVKDWPVGRAGNIELMKVCDGGIYTLLDASGKTIAAISQNYVPHGVIPGECGDYISLHIDADGIITNWPAKPNVSAFFRQD